MVNGQLLAETLHAIESGHWFAHTIFSKVRYLLHSVLTTGGRVRLGATIPRWPDNTHRERTASLTRSDINTFFSSSYI